MYKTIAIISDIRRSDLHDSFLHDNNIADDTDSVSAHDIIHALDLSGTSFGSVRLNPDNHAIIESTEPIEEASLAQMTSFLKQQIRDFAGPQIEIVEQR